MKSLFKTILIPLFCLLFTGQFFAQIESPDIKHVDVVYLNDGSEFRGKLIEYKNGEYVKIKILGGQVLTFAAKEVAKVVQEDITPALQWREYAFKETGVYNETTLHYLQGEGPSSWWTHSFGLHHVTGYQHKRLIGTGIGIGFDGYEIGDGLNFIPIYLDVRGYYLKTKVSPFYSLNLGYGIPVKSPNLDSNITKTKGGMMYNPSLGLRFGGHSKANFTLALGYKVQKATYTFENRWGDEPIDEKYSIGRMSVKLGVLF